MTAPDPAAMLHQLTQHGSPTDRSLLVDFQPLDPYNRPTPFKRYVGLETTPLPAELGESNVRAAEALSGRTRPAAAGTLDAATLARLLFFTAGVTRTSSTASSSSSPRPRRNSRRPASTPSAPSAGSPPTRPPSWAGSAS